MSDKTEAQRLADALEAYGITSLGESNLRKKAAALLRSWPDAGEPVAWMVYTLDGKSVCVTDNPADFTAEHRVLPLYTAPPQRKLAEPVQEAEELKDPAEYDDFAAAIRHNERVTTRRYDSVGPVALEAVYETIIHWDEGGGKRSRRELARRIVDLYTATPAERIAALEAALEQARVALESYAGYIQPLTNVFGGPEVPAEGSTSALVNAALRAIEEVQHG